MGTKRSNIATPTYPEGWVITTECVINGRHVTPGTECSIKGERGRFRFIKSVTNAAGSTWLDFYGPDRSGYRSFSPDRVTRVHRIERTRENASE